MTNISYVYTKAQLNTCLYFLKAYYHTLFQDPLLRDTNFTPSHKFGHPKCCYYQLQEMRKSKARKVLNGITFIPNFVNIGQLVQLLNGTHTADLFSP